jgi:hypothetical protein
MGINLGGAYGGMTEERLYHGNIYSGFEQVCGEGVPQGVFVLLMICTPPRSAIAITPAME